MGAAGRGSSAAAQAPGTRLSRRAGRNTCARPPRPKTSVDRRRVRPDPVREPDGIARRDRPAPPRLSRGGRPRRGAAPRGSRAVAGGPSSLLHPRLPSPSERGRSNVTRNPPSRRFSAEIVPPCSSIIFLTMARPRPVPPLRAEKYGSKSRGRISGGTPGPSSSIVAWTRAPSRPTRSAIRPPPGPSASTAFPIRFEKTRAIRRGSASVRTPGRRVDAPPDLRRAREGRSGFPKEPGEVHDALLGPGQTRVVGELRRRPPQLFGLAQDVGDAILEHPLEVG